MRVCSILAASAAFASRVHGLNILITNDDGFGTANIRELYKQMIALEHNCYIVAPVSDQSSMGGHTLFTSSPSLTTDSEWGIVKAGAPSAGTDPYDNHIWYYNGTPAAQVLVALDYILPTFANFDTPDLVLSGPNFGWTLGPFLYTISGTIGATIAAIERGIPAIAFSSGNTIPTPYFWVNTTTKVGLQDPATITARLASSLVQALIVKANGAPVLPKGYGMTVNLPYITSYASDKCTNPPFVLSRMAQNASMKVSYSSKTGLFGLSAEGNGLCLDGDCSLPIEKDVLNSHCMSAVTPFSVEYISTSYHGECFNTTDVTALVPIVVQTNVSTTPGGGLSANITIVGNVSVTPSVSVPPPAITAITGMGVQAQWSASALMLCLGVAAFVL